jgi:hypothetical protein
MLRKPGSNQRMIIKSSDQVPRATLLKRFPIPRDFGVTPESRIGRGKVWQAPGGAVRVQMFEIYRYDPDFSENPRLDTFEVDLDDCGPMGSRCAHLDQEQSRPDAGVPPLVPRGDLRLLRDEHRWYELARLHAAYL